MNKHLSSIPISNDIVDKPSLAAYSTGFPARSMVPPQAGGQPFYGQDVNGVLKDITSNIQYQQAGNYYQFDADFQKAISGYNQYAVVLNPSDGKLYQSLVDANLAPLSDAKSWGFFTDGKYLPLSGGQLTGPLNVAGNVSSQGSFLSKGQNSGIYTHSKDNANGYCVIQTDDDLFIKKTENNTPASTIASYNGKTDTWDFNTAGLTKNTVPLVGESQFKNDLGAQGYQYFAGGLLMQWGIGKIPGWLITFPIPFAAAPLCVIVADRDGQYPCGSSDWTNINFKIRTEARSFAYTWLAIGIA